MHLDVAVLELNERRKKLSIELEENQKNLNSNIWSEVADCLEEILINRYGAESEKFVMHEEVMRYVKRIDLYYKTLSMMDRDNEMYLLAQK